MLSFRRGDRVLLSTDGIQGSAVTNLGANKLAPRFIGPFKILKVIGDAYTLDIPTSIRLHPTFYVGRLKPYVPVTIPAPQAERPRPARNPSRPAADADAESARAPAPHARASPSVARRARAAPSDETASAARAAPAPTESQQSSRPQYARAQAQRGSEPPSRRPSIDRSPASSTGAPSDSRERLTEDIPDVVKEYEATLALVFDNSGSEDDHDLVNAIAHEYWRGEIPGNDDIIATSISDEASANSRDPNSRDVNNRGASSRDHSNDDHAARSVDMDVSATTSSATRSAARSAMLSSACTCLAGA
ncbi:unnamed protein product [Phytophthora fragariaefolia]|uniref:Unnamed protein product n=1 Tax=Phytophthora fragariaefolia TaxID=1490495 RepID=A0A9W7D596_9STRA|nr:unnamed protein product [Phytophthora fragariaefolia]